MKYIYLILFLFGYQSFFGQGNQDAYLFYGSENEEKCIVKNKDGSSQEVDSFFKMESNRAITFFVCGERFYHQKENGKLESKPISDIENKPIFEIQALKEECEKRGLSKAKAFHKIYLIQKVSPSEVVYYPVKWM